MCVCVMMGFGMGFVAKQAVYACGIVKLITRSRYKFSIIPFSLPTILFDFQYTGVGFGSPLKVLFYVRYPPHFKCFYVAHLREHLYRYYNSTLSITHISVVISL